MRLRDTIGLLLCTTLLSPGISAASGHDDDNDLKNVVYVQSNNPQPGKNAVLGYVRNPKTGVLTEMPGSPFLTGGTGFLNSSERLGPDDADQQFVVTADNRFLYVVNEGSGTIAGFAIQSNGSLKPVPGSPFPSGGVHPVSIGITDYLLFVVNQGDQLPGGAGGTHKPTYASFLQLGQGTLIPLPEPQPSQVAGSSPTQALISPNGRLLFDANLFENPFNNTGLPPFIPPFSSELHSYYVTPIGILVPAAKTAPPSPIPPFILGLQAHPTQKILYAGFVVASAIGTYTYDDNGHMTFVGTAPGAPNGGLCWIAISPNAKNLYTSDAITDQIDVYSIADPLHPVLTQTVNLAGIKNPANFNVTATLWDTTPFQLQTSPDGAFLYVVNHQETVGGNATGNALHILKIGTGGTLTEIPSSPLVFPASEVPNNAHPLGVAVF
ncbi:MAG TPA: hypothetical protein VGK48_12925 [Terriglobia bacterium]|jgi:hypothetical protein